MPGRRTISCFLTTLAPGHWRSTLMVSREFDEWAVLGASQRSRPENLNQVGYAAEGAFSRAWKCFSNTVLFAHSPLKSNKYSSAISKYHIVS
jgi:hypothetical protein